MRFDYYDYLAWLCFYCALRPFNEDFSSTVNVFLAEWEWGVFVG